MPCPVAVTTGLGETLAWFLGGGFLAGQLEGLAKPPGQRGFSLREKEKLTQEQNAKLRRWRAGLVLCLRPIDGETKL